MCRTPSANKLAKSPWEEIAADLFELNKRHYLVVIDYYSRWIEIKVLPSTSNNAVIGRLKDIFSSQDIADKLVSDNGPQFISEEFRQFVARYSFVHTSSPPSHQANRVLKQYAEELSPVLTFIFRQSLANGELPEDWLKANVAPIYKKSDKHVAENYRPVSLTTVCCKVMEHVISKHIRNHLVKHNILTKFQHGFRYKHSCETQLIITVDDIFKHYDKKKQIDVIILDFSKAFDKVSHSLLLSKLHGMGITGSVQKWISAFLTNRTQKVVVNGEFSSEAPVTSGVPQGSLLGPLLFLCYINDLPDCIKSQVRLFADDKSPISPNSKHEGCIHTPEGSRTRKLG